jgi:hypothetical protein
MATTPQPAMATARDGQEGAQSADREADEARYDDRRVHRPGTDEGKFKGVRRKKTNE